MRAQQKSGISYIGAMKHDKKTASNFKELSVFNWKLYIYKNSCEVRLATGLYLRNYKVLKQVT
jgi:hypothetical protein